MFYRLILIRPILCTGLHIWCKWSLRLKDNCVYMLEVTALSMISKKHLKCSGQGLVTPPVAGQLGAEHVRGPSLDQLARVLGQDLRHLPLCPPPLRRVHALTLVIACKDHGCSHTDIVLTILHPTYNPPGGLKHPIFVWGRESWWHTFHCSPLALKFSRGHYRWSMSHYHRCWGIQWHWI